MVSRNTMTPSSPKAEATDLKSVECSFESSLGDLHGRCATCKWWGDPEWDDSHGSTLAGYKTCSNSKIGDSSPWIDDNKASTPDNLRNDALTSAWEEMGAPLSGPRFGCIHWETK